MRTAQLSDAVPVRSYLVNAVIERVIEERLLVWVW